jgi:transaldolase
MAYRIFLDTADIGEIESALKTGVVDGIATNPNKMAKAGRKYADVVRDIRTFFDGPVAVEAVSTRAEDIVEEAQRLSGMAKNMVIKIPTNREGVAAISKLVPMGIVTNSTLICNPAQALVAGLAGSPFISPFINRVNMIGHDGMELFAQVRQMYDFYDIRTQVISASIKNCYEAIQSILAGADAIAVTYEVFCQLFEHPLTDLGIEAFRRDYDRVNKE